MAISWGAWEYSQGNGMRVGIDVTWESVSNSETAATATVKIYTENQYGYGDGQTLNYSGSISGSTNFTNNSGDNNSGGGAVLRATKSYTYTYSSTSYGSSPGNRTFTASLSGAYNSVTPSKSVTSAIPARPIAAPLAVSSIAASRVSDTTTRISWVRNSTSARPYQSIWLYKSVNGGTMAAHTTNISATATSVDFTSAANTKYRFRVYADNTAGTSPAADTTDIYTTPNAPTNASRASGSGSSQDITFTNKTGFTEFQTEIQRGVVNTSTGEVTWTTIVSNLTPNGTGLSQTYNDAGASAGERTKYRVRHKTTAGAQGVLYSAWSNETSETAGVTSPPNAPTGLTPNNEYVDPTKAAVLSWTHNPTDGSGQQQFQVRHRVGAGAWTTEAVATSSTRSWTLPANTYQTGQLVEWQVTTKGADATWSPWSSSAFINMLVTKLIPAMVNLGTNNVEADVSGYDWVYPTLTSPWTNYGSTYGNARYCRRGGIVHVQGLVRGGAVNGLIFQLPEGFRPSQQLMFAVGTNERTFTTGAASAGTAHNHTQTLSNFYGRIDVYANGDIKPISLGDDWISINVSFPADQ